MADGATKDLGPLGRRMTTKNEDSESAGHWTFNECFLCFLVVLIIAATLEAGLSRLLSALVSSDAIRKGLVQDVRGNWVRPEESK